MANVDTNSSDYGNWNTAVANAVNAYNGGSSPGSLVWNGTTLTFTSDGSGAMGNLSITLAATNDAFIEGVEDFAVSLNSPASSTGEIIAINAYVGSVTTTINDTQGDGAADEQAGEWSITGTVSSDENGTAQYTVSLTGRYGVGEVINVDIGLIDLDTNSDDYADFVDAVQDAVNDYSGDGSVSFNQTTGTISFTASTDGDSMSDLLIDLSLSDDPVIEGPERFTVALTSATSPTGAGVALASSSSATTTINDTDANGDPEFAIEWSITGDTSVEEGGNADYRITLTGSYQAGEKVSVVVNLTDESTNSDDYASLDSALALAALGRPDLAYDSSTNTLTFTSPTDGATMAPLDFSIAITNDILIEGDENYSMGLSAASSTTGLSPTIDNGSVATTIGDTQAQFGALDGPAVWSLTGDAASDEGGVLQYTVSLSGTFGENAEATVQLALTDAGTNSSDYADFEAAVNTAIAAYTGDGAYSFDGKTLTWVASNDGEQAGDLVIELSVSNDSLLEGPEDFAIAISNVSGSTGMGIGLHAANNSVTTTISDTDGDGGADEGTGVWSISSAGNSVDEGGSLQYQVSLTGSYGEAEVVTVNLGLTNVDTNSSDYQNFVAAVNAGIAAYTGDGTFTFDGTTLSWAAGADGDTMSDLTFDVTASNDSFVEGLEDFNVGLTNAASSTGVTVDIDSSANSVTTTIDDTVNDGGGDEVGGQWSIKGDGSGDEGGTVQYTVKLDDGDGNTITFGENETAVVDLGLTDVGTNSSDYADFEAAVNAAIASYTGDGSFTFDGTQLVWTAANDGDSMSPLTIELGITNDAFVEGTESFSVALANAGSTTGAAVALSGNTSVTTTINDTVSDGGADEAGGQWSITGDTSGDEGGTTQYTITLDDGAGNTITFGENETAVIDLGLTDAGTNSSDYADFEVAVNAAIAAYNGDGSFTFDGTQLVWTAANDGDSMSPLTIDLSITNDAFVEGPESFSVALANAGSTTGAAVALAGNTSVTTTIDDTVNDGGVNEVGGLWSITGDTSGDEGGTVQYTITLDDGAGNTITFGENETAVVDLGLTDAGTNSSDYADLEAAVNAAIANYTGDGSFAFDGTKLVWTAANDGDSMTPLTIDLDITNDAFVEGPESFSVALANAGSTTGAAAALSGNASVTTTIDDTVNDGGGDEVGGQWAITGDASGDEGGTVQYTITLDDGAGNTITFGENETAVVDLGLTDAGTNSSDYADFEAAVSAAIANYNGDGSFVFDGTQLDWTAANDGDSMSSLTIDLSITNDAFVEGTESFSVALANAGSTTGAAVALSGNTSVTTTIDDTVSDGGVDEVGGLWSITGDTSGDEGGTATFTVTLDDGAGNTITFGENETAVVDLGLTDAGTNSSDYADFEAAVNAAIANHNGDGSFTFDGTQLVWTAANDGDSMSPLTIELGITNDAFVEGTESFSVALANAGSTTGAAVALSGNTSVTTTIDDTVSDGGVNEVGGLWSITGDTSGDEGGTATFTVTLDDGAGNTITFGENETAVVDLGLTDAGTNSSDYADFEAAVNAAIANYTGDGSFVFDGTQLAWTAANDGDSMSPLTIELGITNDAFVEGTESFSVALTNAGSTTGAAVALSDNTSVTTTIDDTVSDGGVNEVGGLWSITGDTSGDEGGTATFTVTLDDGAGNTITFGENETAVVDLGLTDAGTNSSDYADVEAAVNAAIAAYNGDGSFTFDGTQLAWTATNDGDSMSPLTIELGLTNDDLLEGPESFSVALTNAGSTTGAAVALSGNSSLTTTINDTQNGGGDPEVAGLWSINGPSESDEGSTPQYTVSLSGSYGAGEVVSVELDLTDNGTNGDDYGDWVAAVKAAADANPHVTFNQATGTLTYISPSDGASMADLVFELPVFDDGFIEGPESFTLGMTNATSLTDAGIEVDPSAGSITTVVNDTQDEGGDPDGPGEWSITGPSEINEGSEGVYRVGLSGTYQAGEVVSVKIDVTDFGTNSDDYGDLHAAILAAVANNPDVIYDPSTGTVTYTSPGDGAAMTPFDFTLPVNDDFAIESTESFRVGLSDPASSTGAIPTLDPAAGAITTSINSGPVAEIDINVTRIGSPIQGNVLTNDFDPDGEAISVTQVNGMPIDSPIATSNGTVTMDEFGNYTYVPNADFEGTDSFEYEVCDANGNCQTQTVTIEVRDTELPEANPGPVANDDEVSAFAGTPVTVSLTTNDFDPLGGPITINTTPATQPQNGTVVINPDGTFTYTPNAGFEGTDSFVYEIVDANGNVDRATVRLNVYADPNGSANDAPFLGDDAVATTKGVPAEGNLLANDIDPNGDPLTINTTAVTGPEHGTLVIHSDGTFTYTPEPGYEGTDSFVYEACDADGACSEATVYVSTFNQAPVAADDEIEMTSLGPITGNALANDSDPDGDPLSGLLLTRPQHGTVTWSPDGTFTYMPGATFAGTDSFTYTLSDDTGASRTATVTFTMPFAFDSFNNEALRDPFALQTERDGWNRSTLLIEKIHALNPEPILAGYAKPGTHLVARIYAADGSIIGETSTTASLAGNYVMHFYRTQPTAGSYIVIDHVSSESVESNVNQGFRLTNDTYRSMQLGVQHGIDLTAGSILADMPSNALQRMHLQNLNPLTLLD